MVTKYERKTDKLYPIIHHKFTARNLDDQLVEFNVQDLTQDHAAEAIDFIFKFNTPDETFQKAIKLAEKDYAPIFMSQYYSQVFAERISLACFESGTNKLVGVNAMTIKSKGIKDEIPEIDIKELTDLIASLQYVTKKLDVFKAYNVDHYLYGIGLCVDSTYRGRNIATEILKARVPFLKSLNLKVTSTLFTGIGSQKAAEKAGFEEISATSYADLQEKFPDMDFSIANATHCKTQALKI